MMSQSLNVALAAALGFTASAPVYAAEVSQTLQNQRPAALPDGEYRAAMDKRNKLTATDQTRCIVNIRPTVAMTPGSSAKEDAVKDGTTITEAEYAAAPRECESQNAADKDRCVDTGKEHFGRM